MTDAPPALLALGATLLVSAVSLLGIVLLFSAWDERRGALVISFAAGVLLATAFLDLLPEAVELGHDQNVLAATLAAMAAFFLLERALHGFHVHAEDHAAVSGYLILIGDTLHNFIDGVVIAATFLVDPALGLTTTLAVAAHEIPQEIADFGILLRSGFAPRRALLLNLLSALAAVLGAALCLALQEVVTPYLAWFMAATAGMFIYVAASDLLPELHHSPTRHHWHVAAPFVIGMALIAALSLVAPHEH